MCEISLSVQVRVVRSRSPLNLTCQGGLRGPGQGEVAVIFFSIIIIIFFFLRDCEKQNCRLRLICDQCVCTKKPTKKKTT